MIVEYQDKNSEPKKKKEKFYTKEEVIGLLEEIVTEDNVYRIIKKPGRSGYTPDVILNLYGRGFFVFIRIDNANLTQEVTEFLDSFEYSFVVLALFGKPQEQLIVEIKEEIMKCVNKKRTK